MTVPTPARTHRLRDLFLLDPDVTFLNHAAYGATPRPVFETYQRWQRELEREPVDFLSRRSTEHLAYARAALARYVDADADDLVYVNNGTVGMNIIARSMRLGPGDEVVTTDHEHGGIDRLWRYMQQRLGFRYVVCPIPVPVTSYEDFVERLWSVVTAQTRVILVSQLTSPTALVFPVKEICRRSRQAGILSVVDGSHVPGQLALSIRDLDPDFYVGIAHKWLCAPKGSAFLYARRAVQDLLEPLIVSWGWEPREPGPSKFVEHHEWQGSRDISAFLSVPSAIQFQEEHDWATVRAACSLLARETQEAIAQLTGVAPWHPPSPQWHAQVVCAPLPTSTDPAELLARLWHEYRIDVSCDVFGSLPRLRISIQGYNSADDVDYLMHALRRLLRH